MKIGQQLTGESPVKICLVKSKCLSGPNELVRKPLSLGSRSEFVVGCEQALHPFACSALTGHHVTPANGEPWWSGRIVGKTVRCKKIKTMHGTYCCFLCEYPRPCYLHVTRMDIQLTPDNSNIALTRTKIDFPWISVTHLL